MHVHVPPTPLRATTAPLDTPALRARAAPDRHRAWPFGELSERQRHANALFEIAARNGSLRGLPSAFGELA